MSTTIGRAGNFYKEGKAVDKANPIWNDAGNVIDGCTVKTACEWLTQFGGRSPSENIAINGVFYKIDSILRFHPDIARKTIVALDSGYYGNIGFKI